MRSFDRSNESTQEPGGEGTAVCSFDFVLNGAPLYVKLLSCFSL